MPFTFSHPAIVLPLAALRQRWISVTGLVIGSLTPDFEYFLRLRIAGHLSHTVKGLFLFDLPVGLALAFVFHNLVRNSLFANLPQPLASRLAPFRRFNWNTHFKNAWPAVIISTLIGAASHLFWDSFTHRDGFFVAHIPVLATGLNIGAVHIGLYRVLQHISTLAGAIVIGYAIRRLPPAPIGNPGMPTKYWTAVVIIAFGVLGLRFALGFDYHYFGNIVVNIISACMAALVLAPLALRLLRRPM